MHSLCQHSLLLLQRLLPQTASLRPVSDVYAVVQLLLPKTGAMSPVFLPDVVPGHLLRQAAPEVLLAGAERVLPLSAGQGCGNLFGMQVVARQR